MTNANTHNDAVLDEEAHRVEHLNRKAPNQAEREAAKVVVLDEFVQIDAQQLKCDAQVLAKVEELVHAYNVRLVVLVPLEAAVENLDLGAIERMPNTRRANMKIESECDTSEQSTTNPETKKKKKKRIFIQRRHEHARN